MGLVETHLGAPAGLRPPLGHPPFAIVLDYLYNCMPPIQVIQKHHMCTPSPSGDAFVRRGNKKKPENAFLQTKNITFLTTLVADY